MQSDQAGVSHLAFAVRHTLKTSILAVSFNNFLLATARILSNLPPR